MNDGIRNGSASPLGATILPGGTNFAVAAAGDDVLVCLFDDDGTETQLRLPARDGDVFHGFVPGVGPGQRYGFRVQGTHDPSRGLRADSSKLLLDPYARAIHGEVVFAPQLLDVGVDSAPYVPRSMVVAQNQDAARVPKPGVDLADTVLYELHVKGFTQRNPDVPEDLRGTYAGLTSPASLAYLTDLGITTVELLPVHHHVPEPFLVERGRTNYWGYNTIGFFAPHAGYSAAVRAGRPGGQVEEFRSMVDALHGAGLEVVLDVVFNHTAEGGADGPVLCYRGLDNAAYYRLDPAHPERYVDTTGCGNTVNAGDPLGLRLIMDSLRYWSTDMGVDGFRFDLAPSLARQDGDFNAHSAFLDMISQDPGLAGAKLIAEPWDVGQGDSYDLGRFPSQWSEWNGRFRDTVRDFWRSHDGTLADFATRLGGSFDIFGRTPGRRPSASINLVTVHDGFTLADLVSYDAKHNENNGEQNRDGTDDNRSWNCGTEGPTDDPIVTALRARQSRAFLATLLLASGTPLLLGGDERGRTQDGNNNAYCHDDELTWFDWSSVDQDLVEFTRRVVALRRAHPVFRRRRYLTGRAATQLSWWAPDGTPMTPATWNDPGSRAVTVLLDGSADPDLDENGVALVDDDFLVLINGWWEPLDMTLPIANPDRTWSPVLDTFGPVGPADGHGAAPRPSGSVVTAGPRSMLLLQAVSAHQDLPRG